LSPDDGLGSDRGNAVTPFDHGWRRPAQPELASTDTPKAPDALKSIRRTKGVGEKPEIESQ